MKYLISHAKFNVSSKDTALYQYMNFNYMPIKSKTVILWPLNLMVKDQIIILVVLCLIKQSINGGSISRKL